MSRMKLWSCRKRISLRLDTRWHGPRGDRVSHRRALDADARSLLGGNRDSGRNAIQSRRYAHAIHVARKSLRPGASVGAVEAIISEQNLAAFMLAIFFVGLLSFGFWLEKPLIDMPVSP